MLDGIKSFISGASNYIYNLATGQTDKSTSIAQNKLSEPPENSERKSLLGRNISSDLTGASSIFSNLISRITSIFSKQIKGEKITVNEIQTNLIGTLPKITAEDLKDPLITQTSDEDKKKFQEAILNFASKVSVDTLNKNPLKDIILKTVPSLSHENKNNHKIQNYILNIAFVSKASQESNLPGARVGVPKLKMQSMINLINAIDGMDIKRHSFFRHYIDSLYSISSTHTQELEQIIKDPESKKALIKLLNDYPDEGERSIKRYVTFTPEEGPITDLTWKTP